MVREIAFEEYRLILSRVTDTPSATFHHKEDHDVVAVAVHLKGGASFDMDGTRFKTKPGDMWAGSAPKGSTSTFLLPESGFETVSLRFPAESALAGAIAGRALPKRLQMLARSAGDAVRVVDLGRASEAMRSLAQAMLSSSNDANADLLFLETCSHALLALLRHPEPGQNKETSPLLPRSKLEDARAMLEERHIQPPTINALARAVGTNEFALKRSFKSTFGTTIHAYVRRYRMDRATEILDQGASVQQAAAAVGYECPRCFADAFRRTFGVLPSVMAGRSREAAPASNS